MKSLYLSLFGLLLLWSCNETKQKASESELKAQSVSEKIANAHGYENWNNVKKVEFTFQVDRDTIKGNGRSWEWFPKKDSVIMRAGDQNVKYVRSRLDSVPNNADKAFINDKFWVFVPFQLIWDTTATVSEPKRAEAPISNTEMNMITLTYPEEGGYTPGDAYDIYYDNSYMIKEWSYRKGNAAKPTMSTTFENYKDYNGIKIATDHKMGQNNWNLNFTDVSVTMN